MGTTAIGTIYDNGERLVEFRLMNNMAIGGSLFGHKKYTNIRGFHPMD